MKVLKILSQFLSSNFAIYPLIPKFYQNLVCLQTKKECNIDCQCCVSMVCRPKPELTQKDVCIHCFTLHYKEDLARCLPYNCDISEIVRRSVKQCDTCNALVYYLLFYQGKVNYTQHKFALPLTIFEMSQTSCEICLVMHCTAV